MVLRHACLLTLSGTRKRDCPTETTKGDSQHGGSTWSIHDEEQSFTASWVRTLFADSAGRVWVAGTSESNDAYLYKFEDDQWASFSSQDTDGHLNTDPSAIAEDKDGVVWFAFEWGSHFAKYDDGVWSRQEAGELLEEIGTMAFDAEGNLWTNESYDGGARVLWLGDDYPVIENAQWVDEARYRATYDVTSVAPRGDYVASVSGGRSASTMISGTETITLPAAGMPIAAETGFTFTVDYAGEISDRTAPEALTVVAGGREGDPTTVEAIWWAEDPDSEVTGYRHAIGSAAGTTDIVN